jgi:hypothetical protein
MARTYRNRDAGLIKAIHRNRQRDAAGLWAWRGRKDDAILRGQDGAIQMDKCQTATIDNEGGFKLNGHDYIYRKSQVKEPQRKQRQAGKNIIRRSLES